MGHSFCLSCRESWFRHGERGSGQLRVGGISLCRQGLRLQGGNGSPHRRADSGLAYFPTAQRLTRTLGLCLLSRLSREGCSLQEGRPQIERTLASVLSLNLFAVWPGLRRSCQRASCEGPGAWSELQSRPWLQSLEVRERGGHPDPGLLHRASQRYRSTVPQ